MSPAWTCSLKMILNTDNYVYLRKCNPSLAIDVITPIHLLPCFHTRYGPALCLGTGIYGTRLSITI